MPRPRIAPLAVAVLALPSCSVAPGSGGPDLHEGQVRHAIRVSGGLRGRILSIDARATRDNRHGFAAGQPVPYLTITYRVEPDDGGAPAARGTLAPYATRDGLRYEATLPDLPPGPHRLVLAVRPPTVNGFGRHTDAATGVAPWWGPFEVAFRLPGL